MKYLRPQTVVKTAMTIGLLSATGCDKCEQADPNNPFAQAECRIVRLMSDKDIASFQVAVAKDGDVIYEEAFGFANVAEQIPATVESMYLIGSIEKPFVSTALMILHERGQIDLHAPVNDFLGDSRLVAYQGDADDATVARLLLHTTGMPYGYYIAGDEIPQDQKRSSGDLVDLAGVLVVPPGTRFQYTNIGYMLFSDIVREAAGENIKAFIADEIIAPLDLRHSRFFDSVPPVEMIVTQNADGGVLPIAYGAEGYTALYSTASDLVRFGILFVPTDETSQPPILSDSSVRMLWQYKDAGVKYTTRRFAWTVQEEYGFEVLQHGGGGPGIHARLYIIPSENVAIAFLSNAYYSNYWSDPVLEELIVATVSPSERFTRQRMSGDSDEKRPVLDPADFAGKWTGHIEGPKGTCEVRVDVDSRGHSRLRIANDSCSGGAWLVPSRKVKTDYGALLWRFDACIPYLSPYAVHDEVILTVWPQGAQLVGHAAAAREKNFGRGENYVLPQYLELVKTESP